MRLYTVHLKRFGPAPDFHLVKEGFSWPGFFLTAIWALWHRLWLIALALLAVSVVLNLGTAKLGLDPAVRGVLSLGFAVTVGFVANDLRRWALERRGYAYERTVSGDNRESAERRFLDDAPDLASDLAEFGR